MVTLSNKYALIKEATNRLNAIREDYEVWLDYQNSKGFVLVRPAYISFTKTNTVYCILTRPMSVSEWCKAANSLNSASFSPVLLNPEGLI